YELNMTICSENLEFRTNFMNKDTPKPSQLGRCQDIAIDSSHSSQLNISDITPFNTTFNNKPTPQYEAILKEFYFPFNNNQYNKFLSDNNLLHLSFTSFQFRNSDKFDDVFYHNKVLLEKKYSISSISYNLDPSYFFLYPGQAYFITFYPTVIVDDYFNSKLELNPQLKQLPVGLKPNEINFGIRPHSRFFKYEEKKLAYIYTDLLADLGGFYNAVLGIFILFFGMQKLEPWGFAQKYLLSCIPCRKSFMKNLAKKYVSSAGIPLTEKVNERPDNSSLEERVQILETLLQDYYLDVYYLEKIRKVKIKHKRLLEKYNNMERAEQKNDENSEHED
ncbi:10478_t:CDS:2, partial [Rhizophagus irregularis]